MVEARFHYFHGTGYKFHGFVTRSHFLNINFMIVEHVIICFCTFMFPEFLCHLFS